MESVQLMTGWVYDSKCNKKALCVQEKFRGKCVNVVMRFMCGWYIKDKCQLIYLLMNLLKALFILAFFFPQAVWIVQILH